ncbi:LEAF RUST 10 DISEASE-RESISTANCE LOCUS RECEPTOR-LIKE PROTEIN KINASE-like 2.1 [Cornus florida]|uniref:LEAF RUST 10 DISEASE-RESISTANCE LOCUS RECEPTOR-LIKE PROTEIN KINASE-like 2.1 n=1 Tax=Cornus florida TaxID=4283 RepID=UPI0028A020BA|nr:LEAF RUST 10 DISEASE-RESISTANCE LOCUS RECEPTOR-LIKE PROTEIN KINASE-like 2.1 [Cornus florida]
MAIASIFALVFLSHLALIYSTEDDIKSLPTCPQFFQCGNQSPIRFPFTNTTYGHCGIVIDCDHPVPKVELGSQRWYDVKITSDKFLQIHDPLLEDHISNGSCNDKFRNLTLSNVPFISFTILHNLTFFKCYNTPQTAFYFKTSNNYTRYDCRGGYSIYYNYLKSYDHQPASGIVPHECSAIQLPIKPWQNSLNPTNLSSILVETFHLELHISPDCNQCRSRGGQCLNVGEEFQCHEKGKRKYGLILGAGISAAVLLVLVIILCCFRRKCSLVISMIFWKKEIENNQQIELFLKNYRSLAPKRYSYSDVKKMTNSFTYKLGQGGYGGVYKGKLKTGRLVAVKVLIDSKGNGEEFTNEVVSISRTSHVNVVTLLGFCFEGTKRVLIYEFMPNGSLEKFIYDKSSSIKRQLGWETMYEIAFGIARGLEYLHRGCNTRILHFDIKPHNILLDEDFCPKIADFGLSKLCPNKDSIISMLGARGTVGYIAPEVFSRSFGRISHKSDVYSYGMMVLEMVGGRKNIDVEVDHTSEIYFPHWIYNHVELDEDLGLHGIMNEKENERAKKMIIVGLWCIQTDPSNRPSINKVMEMLEGSLASLQIPPKPFLSSPPRPPTDSSTIQIL